MMETSIISMVVKKSVFSSLSVLYDLIVIKMFRIINNEKNNNSKKMFPQ